MKKYAVVSSIVVVFIFIISAIIYFKKQTIKQESGTSSNQTLKDNTIIEGRLIGKWIEKEVTLGAIIIIYENKANQLIERFILSDGEMIETEIIEKSQDGKKIYYKPDNKHGDYLVIHQTGKLGMCNNEREYAIAEPLTSENMRPRKSFNYTKQEIEKIKKENEPVNDPDFARKAYLISKSFVKQSLTSPSSANFPFSDYSYSNVIDKTITISSYVDANNSFGSKIRLNYNITLKLIGSDWADINNWKLIDLRVK